MRAIKNEDLNFSEKKAEKIELAIKAFLISLGYCPNRVSELECRSRDGFLD